MLTDEEFLLWGRSLNLPQETREFVAGIRAADPARRVGGGRRNVSGRFSSRKMGVTIQFESHTVELAWIYEMEYDHDVLEYYDQPCRITLRYLSANGRQIPTLHTPDFFAIRKNGAEFLECKSEDTLRKLAAKNPNRYCQGDDDRWRCPPGEEYAAGFGLRYRVVLPADVSETFQRNMVFLDDYWRSDSFAVDPQVRQAIMTEVAAEFGLRLSALYRQTRCSRDDIHRLIAAGDIYVDLRLTPLIEPERVRVFSSREAAAACQHIEQTTDLTEGSRFVRTEIGSTVTWDGKVWQIVNVGAKDLSLLDEQRRMVTIPLDSLEDLVRRGQIIGQSTASPMNSRADALLRSVGPEGYQVALERIEVVRRHLEGNPSRTDLDIPERTRRDWAEKYKRARDQYGNGFLGLLPMTHKRGNHTPRLAPESQELLDASITEKYETIVQKNRARIWGDLKLECDERGIAAPSYATFCTAVKRRPSHEQTLKRQGPKAAYQVEPFYWVLDRSTPRHGDRPFEIAHIDHTELDVELRDSRTSELLGRPRLTLLVDAFSRRILAFDLGFDPSSYRSCMMILRECVRRHGRLPQIIVVDGGKEFQSIYFEQLLAQYECTKKVRPPAQARFGSVCERIFKTANTEFIHTLEGNTQIMRNVREVTKSVNPKNHASWTLPGLQTGLAEFLFEIYDTTRHPALSQSPRDAFEAGVAATGYRPERLIPYDESFRLATMPSTPRGVAKVMPQRGVKINYIFYSSPRFKDPKVEKTQIPVRVDPWDAGIVYAYVKGEWVKCMSEYYSVFRGRTECFVALATKELRRSGQSQQRGFAITAARLANFLRENEARNPLRIQLLRDQEAATLRGVSLAPVAPEEVRPAGPDVVDDAVESPRPSRARKIYEDF